jgi:hypothetical protein
MARRKKDEKLNEKPKDPDFTHIQARVIYARNES